jgi:hypothetical protein
VGAGVSRRSVLGIGTTVEPAFPETVVKRPATAAQPSFKVRTNAGVIEVMRTAGSEAA